MPTDPPAPVQPRDPATSAALARALAARGPAYRPRTRHLAPDGTPRHLNRLIAEASPYLVQHAHNPVDWHPWGPEALATAAALDRPLFLSVGYATCHWCHVMEEESFDDEPVAAVLNARFVPVKLDREQRPDLDHVFITATQLQQGHAGWPNSVFLLPDGRPFHTGTYFPRDRFLALLDAVARAWATQRPQIFAVADELGRLIRAQGRAAPAAAWDGDAPARAIADLARMANPRHGGFSTTQQFPQEGFVLLALDHWRRTGDAEARRLATATLDAIAAGGIHDHVGGGFHRYTVDPNWRTPHFEKMLYNQGQLARAFIEAWEAWGDPAHARAARRCLAYVLRDMTDAEGAFHAAEDADSLDPQGRFEEGAFYAWTPAAALAVLGTPAACRRLGLAESPTLEAGAVLHLAPGASRDWGAEEWAALDADLDRLGAARAARPRPLRDDKVIAGWNGLMIRALAAGAAAFDDPGLAAAAARAGTVLWDRLWDGGRLHRLWADGAAREPGMLEDYAWLGLGYLALAQATGDALWHARALGLAESALARFADPGGRLRMAEADGPLGPIHDAADGATPAGESAMLELLARLARHGAPASDPGASGASGADGPRASSGARPGDSAAEAYDPSAAPVGAGRAAGCARAAARLRDALAGPLAEVPLLRPDALVAATLLDQGDSGARRIAADGALRVQLARRGAGLALILDPAPGWHLVASAATTAPGTPVAGLALRGAVAAWPEGTAQQFGFAEAPVAVLAHRIEAALQATAPVIALSVQVCSDRECRAPETLTFRLG